MPGTHWTSRRSEALVDWNQPFQFFEPVQDHDHVRRRVSTSVRLAPTDDEEPSVGCDVVGPDTTARRQHGEFEQHLRNARRRASSRSAPEPQTSADRPSWRRIVPGRHATRAGECRRPSKSVDDFQDPDTARGRSRSDRRRSSCTPSRVRLGRRPPSREQNSPFSSTFTLDGCSIAICPMAH